MAYSRSLSSLASSLVSRALDVSGKHFIQHHAGGCEAMQHALEMPIGWTSGAIVMRDYDTISKI